MSVSHPIKNIVQMSDFSVIELEKEVSCTPEYHSYGNSWWMNEECPYSYKYLSLDSLYPATYYDAEKEDHCHPNNSIGLAIYNYMQEMYQKVVGRKFQSILELGTGAGELTRIFQDNNLSFIAVEGSTEGIKRLLGRSIDYERILKYNLKFLPDLNRNFDLVMCTEVAEHVEPFFASKIVENCVRHSNHVWFSAADRCRMPHYHHSNEQQIEVWDNLFAHMGLPFHVPLSGLHARASRLYLKEFNPPVLSILKRK